MDALEKLKQIGEMPDFKPEEINFGAIVPGAQLPTLTPEMKGVADAFSVVRQQNRWQAKVIYIAVEALIAFKTEIDEANEGLATIKKTPMKMFLNFLKWAVTVGTSLAIGYLTHMHRAI